MDLSPYDDAFDNKAPLSTKAPQKRSRDAVPSPRTNGPETKVLFVDARYTLQAAQEFSGTVITCAQASLNDPTVQQWFLEHIPSHTEIIYDPRNLSVSQSKTLKDLLPSCEYRELLFVKESKEEFIIHEYPPQLAGRTRTDKIAFLRATLQPHQGLVLSHPESIADILNLRSRSLFLPIFPAYFFLTQQTAALGMRSDRFAPGVQETLKQDQVSVFQGSIEETLKAVFPRPTISELFIDPTTTSQYLFEALKGYKRTHRPDASIERRCKKTPTEIANARRVHAQEGAALIRLWTRLKHQQDLATEGDIEAALEALRQEIPSYHGPSFPSIVAFGKNAAVVHYVPKGKGAPSYTDSQAFKGSETSQNEANAQKSEKAQQSEKMRLQVPILLLDVGGQYDGATTDLTRTLWLGSGAPPQTIVQTATRVLKGHIALAAAVFPKGTTGAQLDTLARQFLWQNGQDFAHGTGHGIGNFLAVHEGPFGISPRNRRSLPPGMIVSNEPGFYAPGAYGIRLENAMVVTEKNETLLQFDVLTRVPFDLELIDFEALSRFERLWLKKYYQRIVEDTAPFLEGEPLAELLQMARRVANFAEKTPPQRAS